MALSQRLPVAKADYLRGGLASVEGWLRPSAAFYLSSLEVLQRHLPVAGDVCEIGIHHGKSFLCLALGLAENERAVAVDIFGDQSLNPDNSGYGDREVFERNLSVHGAGDNVDIVQTSSLELEARGFLAAGRRFRLFSIDGGHTPEVTRSDLAVAERSIVDGGLVVLDDVLNPHWLGVITGLFDYWAAGGTLVPVAIIPGKLLLAGSVERADTYRRLMAEHFVPALRKSDVPLGRHEIDIYHEHGWIVLDEAGRTGPLYGTPRGEAAGQSATASSSVGRGSAITATSAARRRASIARRAARRIPGLARGVRLIRRKLRRRPP